MEKQLADHGIRLTIEAEELLKEKKDDKIVQKILELGKPLITKNDIENLIKTEEKVESYQPDLFKPIAKEYEADVKVLHYRDVTDKSRTSGKVEDFINYFRNRYSKLARMIHFSSTYPKITLEEVKKYVGEKVNVIVVVREKRETKKGNLFLEVEDLTGTFKVVISSNRNNDQEARSILLDDVIGITGKVMEPYIIAESIQWPNLPITRERNYAENDLAVVYLSDIHFGSRYFLERNLRAFVDWLHGKGEGKELAGKVKYIVIAGDVVDGVGIYPNQEKELIVKDIYQQYKMFDDFVESLPDYITVIVGPGNHDGVRRGEPMPAIGSDLINAHVIRIGSPSTVIIEGLKHVVYHGTSIDSLISALPHLSYAHPERVMVEFLKRRHLSPIYGENLIVPEKTDYLVIEEEPDVLHCGHVHKNGYLLYRGTLIVNSGTFQERTEFQIKQGHMPTPALVPVHELKYGRIKTLDFRTAL
jgi:DNA polymerase II small subunit